MKKVFLVLLVLLSSPMAFAQQLSLQELLDSLQVIITKEKIPGISLALVHKDSIIFAGGVGYANLEKQEPVNADHLFRIGSVSKTFTSLAIMRLIEQGKFSLNSKLRDIALEINFRNDWEDTHPIRVINLLEHTTGFDDMHFKDMKNYTSIRRDAMSEVRAQQNSLYTRWRPGTRSSYSNPGYTILGYLISKYSGMDYRDFIEQEVLEPLHMHNTTFDYRHDNGFATGYYLDGTQHKIADPVLINGEAAGAISASATDMARFVKFFLQHGDVMGEQLFDAEVLHTMSRSHSSLASQAGLQNGYGLALYSKPRAANADGVKTRFVGHDGGIMGFVTDMGFNKELGLGYYLSNNGEKGNTTLTRLVVSFLIGHHQPELPQPVSVDAEKLKTWEGFYRLENSRNQVMAFLDRLLESATVKFENDTLIVNAFTGDKQKYVALADMKFRRVDRDYASLVFLTDGDRKVMMSGDTYLYRDSAFMNWLLRIVMLLWVLVGLSLVIALLVWLIMWLTKNISFKDFRVRALPALAFISFAFALFCFIDLTQLKNITTSNDVNWRTAGIFLGTLLLAVFAVLGIWQIMRHLRNYKSTALKIYLLVSATLMLMATLYFGLYDWIGLKVWTY